MSDHNCDCGCEHHDHDEDLKVTLTLDNDEEIECVVLTIFPVEDKEYIALMPDGTEEDEEGEIFLYRYSETEDGQPSLDNIDSDDEYELVADAFDQLLDEVEAEEE